MRNMFETKNHRNIRGITPGKYHIPDGKSGPKNLLVPLFSLLLIAFLVDIAIFGVLTHQDENQNDFTNLDLEYKDPNLTYHQSYSYIDSKDGLIESEELKLDTKKVRGDSGHPLSNDTTVLFELDEIAIGTLELEEYGTLKVFDDTYNQSHEIFEGEFEAQNEKGADMVCGNFDGDSADELVLSYELDFLENGTLVSKTQLTFYDDANSGFELMNTTVIWITYASMSSGDFDGDGLDEVAVVGNNEGEGFMAGVVFDDYLAQEPIIHIWDHIMGSWEENPNATREHDTASGDFDGDKMDELVTVGRINDTLITWVWKLNDDPAGPPSIYYGIELVANLPEINFSKGLPSISSGNIDLDPQDELIITTHDENFKLYFRIHDDMHSDFDILRIEKDNITIRTTESTMGDVDGDGLDEIFVVGHHVANPIGRIYDDAEHNFAVLKVLDIYFEDRWYYWYNLQVDCGDVDGDGVEEYFMFGQSWWQLHGELYDDLERGSNNTMIKRWVTGYKLPSMAIGNFDEDGLILEYTGEHESFTTYDSPLVVMAAAPQVEGKQRTDNTQSRFGVAKSQGASGDHQLKVTAGLSMSFNGEPIELAGGVRKAFLSEFEKSETPLTANAYNISFEGNYPDDYVVYHNTTYEVYTYRIISWPQNEDRVGENFTINVPLKVNVGHKSLSSFISESAVETDLGNGTFSHVPGNPESYSGLALRNSTLEYYPGLKSNVASVGEGEGHTNVILDLEDEDVDSELLNFGMKASDSKFMENKGFTSTVSFSSDMIYEISMGESTQFEGIIGNFNDAKGFKRHGYSFGIYLYQENDLKMGQTYLIMNYWVEGYEGHLESAVDGSDGMDNENLIIYIAILGIGIVVVGSVLVFKRKNKEGK